MRNPTFVGHKVKHYPHLWLKVKTRSLPTHADGVSHPKIRHFGRFARTDLRISYSPRTGKLPKNKAKHCCSALFFQCCYLGTVLTHVVIFQANCFAGCLTKVAVVVVVVDAHRGVDGCLGFFGWLDLDVAVARKTSTSWD